MGTASALPGTLNDFITTIKKFCKRLQLCNELYHIIRKMFEAEYSRRTNNRVELGHVLGKGKCHMDHVIVKRVLRGSWICVVLISSILAVYWLLPLVYPFLIAWLISYAMHPFVLWLQKSLRVPKWLAVTLSLLIYFGSAGIIVSAALTRLVKELIHLAESFDLRIAEWRNLFVSWTQSEGIQSIITEINRFIADNPGYENTIHKNIDNTAERVGSFVSHFVNNVLETIVTLLSSLPNLGVILGVILLATFLSAATGSAICGSWLTPYLHRFAKP